MENKITFLCILTFLAVSTVTATLLEKIFTHDRGQLATNHLQKISRVDDDDLLERAYQEIREAIPKYTGYFFVDLIFQVLKSFWVFTMSVLFPVDENAEHGLRNRTRALISLNDIL